MEGNRMTVTMAEVRNRQRCYIANVKDFPSCDDFVLHVGARIFSYLAETAGPIVEHYHSDLFHDALRLQELVSKWNRNEDLVFHWSVNDCGTFMSSTGDNIAIGHRDNAFRCVLWVENDTIRFSMNRL